MQNTRPSQKAATQNLLSSVALALLVLTFLAAALFSRAAQAQTLNVLYAFTGGGDGSHPFSDITIDGGGKLYGTASMGGTGGGGEVFQLRKLPSGNWIINILHEFQPANGDGGNPIGGVSFGPEGLLYGTAGPGTGNYGIVYRLQPPVRACTNAICPWNETILYSFQNGADGAFPAYGNPAFDRAGNLYGTTGGGGISDNGVVFELTPSNGGWTETVLHKFDQTDGSEPYNSVILDGAGNVYGTTYSGGDSNWGTVFELSPSGSGWNFTTVKLFYGPPRDAGLPYSPLIFDTAGNLYGATYGGGQNGGGAVYELTPSGNNWNFATLYGGFPFTDGGGPVGTLAMDAAGNLYGTTLDMGAYGLGAVYKLTPSNGSWTYSSVHDFTGGDDGSYPYSGVTLDTAGNLYGTTSQAGRYGNGTVWEITP
jgi:uncharacterized repeat protein (TIGR03803 family)